MAGPGPESRPTEITILIVLMSVLVLTPPILTIWSANDNPWYTPYLVWLGIIMLSFWLQRYLKNHAV